MKVVTAAGHVMNHKRTYRIYREEVLQVRTRRRRKLTRPRVPMLVPDKANQRWSMDLVSDQLTNGRCYRVLNIVDDYSRECVRQIVDTSISGERVARALDQLSRPLPRTIVVDNGLPAESSLFAQESPMTATLAVGW